MSVGEATSGGPYLGPHGPAQVSNSPTSPTFGTIGELCDKWWMYNSPDLSPAVVREYRQLIDRRLVPAVGRCRPARCDTSTRCCTVRSSRASSGTGSATTLLAWQHRHQRAGRACASTTLEIDAHYTQPADQRASTTLANSLDVHR
jgi:hypothetical protein